MNWYSSLRKLLKTLEQTRAGSDERDAVVDELYRMAMAADAYNLYVDLGVIPADPIYTTIPEGDTPNGS